jgi:hypothetical protein
MRWEKTKANKIRNIKGEFTTSIKEIWGIIRDYLENISK